MCSSDLLNSTGHIIAYGKVRGKKSAIKTTVETMLNDVYEGAAYAGKCFICHSNCVETAEETADLVRKTFPELPEIRIANIGTIIASHSGPGTVALFFLGKPRVGLD